MFNSSFMSVDHTRLLLFIVCLMHTMEESNEYQGQFEVLLNFTIGHIILRSDLNNGISMI